MTRSVIASSHIQALEQPINPNLIINGDFRIWQRGTSHTSTSVNEYSADRFRTEGNTLSTTISRQTFTAGQTDVPNFPVYYARIATSASPSAGQHWALMQRIEAPLNARQGQTYTLSYWIRSTSGTVAASAFTYGFGGTGSVRSNSPALTTTWQKVTNTQANVNLSGSGAYLSAYLMHVPDTAPSSISVEIANVKVEEGSKATDFEYRSFGEEYNLCYRYYFNRQGSKWLFDLSNSDAYRRGVEFWPVTMRAAPSVTITYAGTPGTNRGVQHVTDHHCNTWVDSVTGYAYYNSIVGDAEL